MNLISAFMLVVVQFINATDFSIFYRALDEHLGDTAETTVQPPFHNSLFNVYFRNEIVHMIDDIARQGTRVRVPVAVKVIADAFVPNEQNLSIQDPPKLDIPQKHRKRAARRLRKIKQRMFTRYHRRPNLA